MPILGGFLLYAFDKLVDFFGTFFGRKLAIGTAFSTFLITGWIALTGFIAGIINAVTFTAASSDILTKVFGVVLALLPTNMPAFLSAVVAIRLGRWVWDRQREVSDVMAKV